MKAKKFLGVSDVADKSSAEDLFANARFGSMGAKSG
jgi:hypothetical protein